MARPFTETERIQKKKEFLNLYEKCNGLTYLTCHNVGISPETLSNWRQKDKDFDNAIKDIDERVGDIVVGKLMESIMRGDKASIFFWLKTQKGWRETQKIELETNDIDINAAIDEIKREMTGKGGNS